MSTSYTEYLRGYNGHDIIEGQAGDDRLGGGWGADTLNGGGGVDVVYSGQDSVVDLLNGGFTDNTLCANHPRDLLVGASSVDDHTTVTMYYSSGSGASINSSTTDNVLNSECGHTSYGTGWGDCGVYNLVAAPPGCAALGLGN